MLSETVTLSPPLDTTQRQSAEPCVVNYGKLNIIPTTETKQCVTLPEATTLDFWGLGGEFQKTDLITYDFSVTHNESTHLHLLLFPVVEITNQE